MKTKTILKALLKQDKPAVVAAIASGLHPDEADGDGRTPLMHAVLIGSAEFTTILLTAGADAKRADKDGFTALHFAAQEYAPEIAQILIQNGAEVDAVDQYGNTPLARAAFASRGRGDVIKILLAAGANPDLQNQHGMSARSLAKSIANYDVQQFFR